jgi:hypothetical protein
LEISYLQGQFFRASWDEMPLPIRTLQGLKLPVLGRLFLVQWQALFWYNPHWFFEKGGESMMSPEDQNSAYEFAYLLAKAQPQLSDEAIAKRAVSLLDAVRAEIERVDANEKKLRDALRQAAKTQANDVKQPEPGTGAQTVTAPGYKRQAKKTSA